MPALPLPSMVASVFLLAVSSVAPPAHMRWAAAAMSGSTSPESALVAIDVGHSQDQPGASSARGVPEFEYNRALSVDVERALRRRGMRTLRIGARGDAHDLAGRTAEAAAAGAGFFISLHHDSVQPQYLRPWRSDDRALRSTDRFSGFSIFVSRRNPEPALSLACARAIGGALRDEGFHPSLHHAEPIVGENRPLADAKNGVYWFDSLMVLRTARSPAVLLEAGIIVNRAEEVVLGQPTTRTRIATAVAEAVKRCLPRS
jgi:N-acetylmuramoyl-L-alanine amidase